MGRKGSVRRRRFGQASGRHSRLYKRNEKDAFIKQEDKTRGYVQDIKYFKPYQIIRKCSGKSGIRIVVRRMPKVGHIHAKLIKINKDTLTFKMKESTNLSGNRIINLPNLAKYVSTISKHSALCSAAQRLACNDLNPVVLNCEKKANGLFSVLVAKCKGCDHEFEVETSTKQGNGEFDVNVRAVWGSVASGCGSTDLNEVLTTMDIPPIPERKFSQLEEDIGKWWLEILNTEMMKAAQEEKEMAIKKGNFHQNVPAITVICDGGWSKRTHKHTYNAAGGVGVIFGAESKKLLYIGVKNKYCIVCKRAENQQKNPREHRCFKNWTESSQSMESEIILEGFLDAETKYGLRYTKIIADGDSSVYSTLQECVPIWGKDIKKLECANHACKCLRSSLEKLVTEKPQYKGKGKLTKFNRIRITTAVRCAIKMRSKTNDSKQLKKDIINSVYHVLGFHLHCSDFCSKRKGELIPDTSVVDEDDDDDTSFDVIFQQQMDHWKSPDDDDMEKSRVPVKNLVPLSELKDLIQDVQVLLNRLANKSERLIGNFTTNLAESWMAIRAKFDGGKVVNRCSRGSWETRCYGGALRKNLGAMWSPLAFQTSTKCQAGTYFQKGSKRQLQQLTSSSKYRQKAESKILRRKSKTQGLQQATTKKAKRSYGGNLDDSSDVPSDKLQKMCDNYELDNFRKKPNELENLQKKTINQSSNDLWKSERKKRLTSSYFGKVMSRKLTNISTCLVKDIIYSTFKGNVFTLRGLSQEKNTIIEYKNLKGNVEVSTTGLKVCESHQFLGASTDGIVVEHNPNGQTSGLLEIKNFLQNNTLLIKEAIKKTPQFCLETLKDKIKLKRNHNIYFQIQGQLNIFNKEWCDFVVRRTNPYDIHVERIYRDGDLWTNRMLPKLECFYRKFLLPEIACPRYWTYTGIREPTSPWYTPPQSSSCNSRRMRSKVVEPLHAKLPTTSKRCRSQTSLSPPRPTSPTPSTSQGSTFTNTRSRRTISTKFLGREIIHEWIVDDKTKEKKWFHGIVTDVIKGKDGHPDAVYDIYYKEEDTSYEIDNLQTDFLKGSVKFKDI